MPYVYAKGEVRNEKKHSLATARRPCCSVGIWIETRWIYSNTNKIRAYALKWAKAHKIKYFKETSGGCSHFMNIKNLAIRQKTQIVQKLPRYLDNEVANFHRFIIWMRKINQYPHHCIANIDDTPLNFEIMADRAVDIKGAKTVHVRGTGHEKTRCMVMLSCMADGTKLKPMVISKGKT